MNGPEGFPDGRLKDRFESIRIRHRQDSVQLKSGRGSFQAFLKNMYSLAAERDTEDLVQIHLQGAVEPGARGTPKLIEETVVAIRLWNYRPTLFPVAMK